MTEPVRPTRLEVDLGAIRHNVRRLAEVAAPAAVCAVVKADGYGHGAVEVARAALEAGAAWLAVALVEEGEELRAAGIDAPCLVLSEPPVAAAGRLLAADLVPSVYTAPFADHLAALGRAQGRSVSAHLCFDTGMGRVGAHPDDPAVVTPREGLTIRGVWTHFPRADEPDEPVTARQLEKFGEVLGRIGRTDDVVVHAANSAGTLLHPGARYDLVRCGIAMYGLSPAPDQPADRFGLRQALQLASAVSFVKRVPAGTALSYGHTWTCESDGWVATVPIGYADGVPRALSNRASLLLGGVRRPIVGNVTMDQLMVWCGDDEPAPGDEVVLLGGQGDAFVSVDEWAAIVGTISYEIACGMGARVPRHHHG